MKLLRVNVDVAPTETGEGAPQNEEDSAADATQIGAETGTTDAASTDADAGASGTDAAGDAGKGEAGSMCMPGHADCSGGTDCECATPACCNGACQTTHSNGEGQSFYDCTGQGTHNQTQAEEACAAFTGSSGACKQSTSGGCNCLLLFCGASAQSMCGMAGSACHCWQYSGPNAGKVESESTSNCKASCGSGSDPSWN